ncbi:hypothetical protein [Nocardia thailandica]|uniref:hypothetical protein n=1 Tax=Nocardia thailandica TaxID=257275 RepID=UPI0002E49E75|nr:hypothetical protein [Nocardia thailandica]
MSDAPFVLRVGIDDVHLLRLLASVLDISFDDLSEKVIHDGIARLTPPARIEADLAAERARVRAAIADLRRAL